MDGILFTPWICFNHRQVLSRIAKVFRQPVLFDPRGRVVEKNLGDCGWVIYPVSCSCRSPVLFWGFVSRPGCFNVMNMAGCGYMI